MHAPAIRRLGPHDIAPMRSLNALFARVFDDAASYASNLPEASHLARILARDHVIALVASVGDTVVGGLVAYRLDKLEQARSEVYLYDLAVEAEHRRRGIATALIEHLVAIAAAQGAWVVYVQADHGDDPAVALYEKLGAREDVMHFDIPVRRAPAGQEMAR